MWWKHLPNRARGGSQLEHWWRDQDAEDTGKPWDAMGSPRLGVEAAPFLAKRLLGSGLRDGAVTAQHSSHSGKAQGLKSEPAIQRTSDDQ